MTTIPRALGTCALVVGVATAAVAEDRCAAFEHQTGEPQRLQVGEYEAVKIATDHPYGGAASAGHARLAARHVLSHPGATYIAPRFSRFELAPGDWVEVRSPDGSRSWRYEGNGKAGLGRTEGFWGIHIPGDTAVVELYATGAEGGWGFEIDRYARGTVDLWSAEAICGVDDKDWAKCYQVGDADIYDHSRVVARLLIQGSGLCTGWLVGNEGHVMTNNHCITTGSDAANTDFEFMAEGNCGQFCGILQCPGTIVATSSTLIRTSDRWDYSLVRLPVNPTGTYGYAQLRESGPVVGERIYIPQHPGGKGKQIAVASTHAQNPSGFGEVDNIVNASTGAGLRRTALYFADTEGGSSGSPVFAHSDHRVVALHFGAFDCVTNGNGGTAIDAVLADLGSDVPQGALSMFEDGFESGNTTAWSSAVP